MATSFTANDIELLGYSEPKVLFHDPQATYTIFEAAAVAGLEEVTTRFIYLKANCTIKNARIAKDRYESTTNHTYAVVPESLSQWTELRSVFGSSIPIVRHEELMRKKLRDIFIQYIKVLHSSVKSDENYIPPKSVRRDINNKIFREDIESNLMSYMCGRTLADNGTLLVLSAHAGVGKTTVSRHLIHTLADHVNRDQISAIPVYVEAQHWGKLRIHSIDDLWEVIDNSLRAYSSNLSLRRELFYYALREGYLSFIFDGFDELCGHKTSQFRPITVLEQLANISSKSEARILVTTRTHYWNSEIEEAPENVKIVYLDTFNTQEAKGYFNRYFRKNHTHRNQANQLYKELIDDSFRPRDEGGTGVQFVNLPLCVAMIAGYIRDGGGPTIRLHKKRELLENLLLSICRREQERKQLRTSAADQLASFKDLAVFDVDNLNPVFDLNLLEATNFEDDIEIVRDHPLLQPEENNTQSRFRYDFLGPYLRALSIAESLSSDAQRRAPDSLLQLKDIMHREADGNGYVSEQLCGILQSSESDIQNVALAARHMLSTGNAEAASFLFHICKNLIYNDSHLIEKKERTESLFQKIQGDSFIKNRNILNWSFFGILDRMDFREIHFDACKFINVTFRSCEADKSTFFHNCIFSEDMEIKSSPKSWSDVQVHECKMNFPTDIIWGKILNKTLGSKEEQMQKVLRIALGRFWSHGRLNLSMRSDDWSKGILRNLEIATDVLDIMIKEQLVEKIHISGVSEGGIAFDRSSLSDLQNYMDNQQLQGKIRKVFRRLVSV